MDEMKTMLSRRQPAACLPFYFSLSGLLPRSLLRGGFITRSMLWILFDVTKITSSTFFRDGAAWLLNYRRHSRDCEVLTRNSEAFIQVAMIRLLVDNVVYYIFKSFI